MVPFLATTGSAAPFIGLFGTVLGIMFAFIDISQSKEAAAASIKTVGPHISEALLATALGLAAAIPSVTIGGTKYREFSLDANDTGSDDYMSIDEFKVFLDNQSDLHSYNDVAGTFGNDDSSPAVLKFQAPGVILMRSQTLTPGSGVSDITVDVPDNLFPAECYYGSQACNKWVILFTHMGGEGTINVGNGCNSGCNYNVSGGFEEWRTQRAPVVNVLKTATPTLTRTFPWTLKKEVSVDGGATWVDASANLNLFNGDNANIKWRITYTKGTPVDSNQHLTGSVTVTNPTGRRRSRSASPRRSTASATC